MFLLLVFLSLCHYYLNYFIYYHFDYYCFVINYFSLFFHPRIILFISIMTYINDMYNCHNCHDIIWFTSPVPVVWGHGVIYWLKQPEGIRKHTYGVTSNKGVFRSWFCTEKPHSMTHWTDTYTTVGRIGTISITVKEARMKSAVQGAQDQQPGLVRREPPQEQHGCGGGNAAVAAPGWDRVDPSLHHLRLWIILVCTLSA